MQKMPHDLSERLPKVRGRLTPNAPLGSTSWFRTGGPAEILFKPRDQEDLQEFMAACPHDVPVQSFGVMSNVIIRDGGLPGVTLRLGRDFAHIEPDADTAGIHAGAAALDQNLARIAAESGIGGLGFYSGIPGSVGGALVMNAGAYGGETRDVLSKAQAINRAGECETFEVADFGYGYRYSQLARERPELIWIAAFFQGSSESPDRLHQEIEDIRARREATQPIRAQTGGSTFKNPTTEQLEQAGLEPGTKAWMLIERVGGRELQIGGARMSEKHGNFMLNTGEASASDLEDLGEELRARVKDQFGLELEWEIRRVGIAKKPG